MPVHLRLVYLLVSLGPSDLSSGTDVAFRYIRLRLADDDSCIVLYGTVVRYSKVRVRKEIVEAPNCWGDGIELPVECSRMTNQIHAPLIC